MGTCVATLSLIGFIGDEQMDIAMDRHLTYWFASRKDQSKIIGDVPSFEYLLSLHQGNKSKLVEETYNSLKSYFKEIVSNVDVIVKPLSREDSDSNYTLAIALKWENNGVVGDLQSSVIIAGGSYKLVKEGRSNATPRTK